MYALPRNWFEPLRAPQPKHLLSVCHDVYNSKLMLRGNSCSEVERLDTCTTEGFRASPCRISIVPTCGMGFEKAFVLLLTLLNHC